MQVRPPASGPSTEYHPPLPPSIPLSAINTLIPRLTTTINDIDSLRNLIGSGYVDGTLPSWDTLLQRYSLLLGRINALTNYLSPPPPSLPSSLTGAGAQVNRILPQTQAQLSNYLIHPLNPLPTSSSGTGAGPTDLSPFAQEAFLQSINTQLLPSLTSIQSNLLTTPTGDHTATTSKEGGRWHSPDELRRMDERDLEILRRSLKGRLNKENLKIDVLKREIQRREEEVDWTMRIGEDDEDEEEEEAQVGGEEGEGGQGKQKEESQDEEDEDDLFGGDDDDDEPMIIDVDAEKPQPEPELELKKQSISQEQSGDSVKESVHKNWKVEDYILFMDTGKQPNNSM